MKTFKALFEIAEEINCPLYAKGDQMTLTEKTFSCPEGKEVCLILVRDMTQLLFVMLKQRSKEGEKVPNQLFGCSGCTGLIKFRQISEEAAKPGEDSEKVAARMQAAMQEIHGRVMDCAFLRALPSQRIAEILQNFEELSVSSGSVVVRQGEPNPNLYLIMEGEFVIEISDQMIATLGAGEIFGEMSYLGIGDAVATVRARKDSLVLAINSEDFGQLVDSATSVQLFMAKLLAERLQQINIARARDFDSCMSGRLDQVVPAELFQVFHMHQKTGVLKMQLSHGEARVSFREGCIINAQYGSRQNEAAIFAMLAEKHGLYRFTTGLSPQEMKAAEIGDFMALLMEGVKRVDESGSV